MQWFLFWVLSYSLCSVRVKARLQFEILTLSVQNINRLSRSCCWPYQDNAPLTFLPHRAKTLPAVCHVLMAEESKLPLSLWAWPACSFYISHEMTRHCFISDWNCFSQGLLHLATPYSAKLLRAAWEVMGWQGPSGRTTHTRLCLSVTEWLVTNGLVCFQMDKGINVDSFAMD